MQTPLKLMTFNISEGGGNEARFARILDLLRRTTPDILILQECEGWEDSKRLAQVSEALGLAFCMSHSRLGEARPRGSGQRHNVAAFSRLPFKRFETHNNAAFLGHCLVEFEVDWDGTALTVFGTQFDAKNENLRFVEARYLRSLLDPAKFRSGLYALAGDLNSLSFNDPYPVDLEAMLRESRTTKYHLPPRYEVLNELADFGWVDGLYLKTPARWVTAPRSSGGVSIDFRTDYLMFSPALAAHVGQTEVVSINDESDHFPVLSLLI
jgi:exodeoxyribonuclease III